MQKSLFVSCWIVADNRTSFGCYNAHLENYPTPKTWGEVKKLEEMICKQQNAETVNVLSWQEFTLD